MDHTRHARLALGAILSVSSALLGDRAHDLAQQAKSHVAAKCEYGIQDRTTKVCHEKYPTGCSGKKYDAYLNFLKNQVFDTDPQPAKFLTESSWDDLEKALPKELGKSNHADVADKLAPQGEGNPHALIGYLYFAEPMKAESCNCGQRKPEKADYHIGIGFDPTVAEQIRNKQFPKKKNHSLKQASIVVEMTPHYRALRHPQWTVEKVRQALGRQVKVVGQLIVDNEHLVATQDCGHPQANQKKCWRKSGWELHPVTDFYVCPSASGCSQDSQAWQKLDDLK